MVLRARFQQSLTSFFSSDQTLPLDMALRALLQHLTDRLCFITSPSIKGHAETDPATAERLGLDRRTGLLITYLHLLSEYFLLDGACLRTSAYALHPYRNNLFLVGACLSTSSCTLHPYRENSFLVGVCLRTFGCTLHP